MNHETFCAGQAKLICSFPGDEGKNAEALRVLFERNMDDILLHSAAWLEVVDVGDLHDRLKAISDKYLVRYIEEIN